MSLLSNIKKLDPLYGNLEFWRSLSVGNSVLGKVHRIKDKYDLELTSWRGTKTSHNLGLDELKEIFKKWGID